MFESLAPCFAFPLQRFAQRESDIFRVGYFSSWATFRTIFRACGQSSPAPALSSLPKAGMFEPLAILITHGPNRRHILLSDV
jgi:hypothetical protein